MYMIWVETSSSKESDNSSGNTNSTESLYPNFQKAKGFHAVPPPIEVALEVEQADKTELSDLNYEEELKFNLLSVSQICDKKHNVLFTDKECLILSPKFKFVDEDLVILRAPRKNDVYSLDLKNIIPLESNLFWTSKATTDELL
ncbi:hypothetical protein Tco_1549478 [Tanacetum coccineum]